MIINQTQGYMAWIWAYLLQMAGKPYITADKGDNS
jgi:hypothetical protein